MTATQTVAVTSAPGMKAREPSFTLDSDDDDGDTVEREISLEDDDDDDDGTKGATAGEEASTAPSSTVDQFALDRGMSGLRVATGREDPPVSVESKPFWEHDFASEYDFAKAQYAKAVEEATSPKACTAGHTHASIGKSGLRVDPKEAERWRRAARERAQVVTEVAAAASKRVAELWGSIAGRSGGAARRAPAQREEPSNSTERKQRWTEMRGVGDGDEKSAPGDGAETDPEAPTGDPSFGGRDRSPRAAKDDVFTMNPALVAAEDRCAAAEAATKRAEEKIEALTEQLSDARRECEALRAALADVDPAHPLVDGSNDRTTDDGDCGD
jgi:hypothetical protein